jgi:hypothetical protein
MAECPHRWADLGDQCLKVGHLELIPFFLAIGDGQTSGHEGFEPNCNKKEERTVVGCYIYETQFFIYNIIFRPINFLLSTQALVFF